MARQKPTQLAQHNPICSILLVIAFNHLCFEDKALGTESKHTSHWPSLNSIYTPKLASYWYLAVDMIIPFGFSKLQNREPLVYTFVVETSNYVRLKAGTFNLVISYIPKTHQGTWFEEHTDP